MLSPHAAPSKIRALAKNDSVVMLERFESTASDYAYVRQDTPRTTGDPSQSSQSGLSVVQLDVSIRFGALAVVASLMVSAIAVSTIVFMNGVELTRFELSSKDAAAQTQLLDKYNSFTGNVSSMFGKPIEVFVTIAVQILLLRVLQSAMLQTRIDRRLDLLAFVLSAGVGYLINNGFNALNVQLRPLTIQPAMSLSELVYKPTIGMEVAMARSSRVSATFSERSVRNPITNTALRNLVLPRQPKVVPFCDWAASNDAIKSYTYNGYYYEVVLEKPPIASDFVLEYGFAQREWQSRLLEEAIEPKVLRVALNASEPKYNLTVNAANLPMKASTAADLALQFFSAIVINFLSVKVQEFTLNTQALNEFATSDSAARLLGLLPTRSAGANETLEWEWMLNKTVNVTRDMVQRSQNVSSSNAAIEFSRVTLSPTVTFDALTLEFEKNFVEKSNKTQTKWFNRVDMREQCGPWPGICMIPKKRGWEHLPAQVQVYAACANSAGMDETTFVRNGSDLNTDCDRISNTSLMVFSVGKRLVADKLTDSTNETTNLRMAYTVTVGKLSWVLSDLAQDFNAECSDGDKACKGIAFPLSSSPKSMTQSQLVVAADALPMNLFFPVKRDDRPRYIPLVHVHEPHHYDDGSPGSTYDATAGDLLLPHNVMNTTWSTQKLPDRTECSAYTEERIQQVLDNHLYIEHGLQTAYTAAAFFLLQNGVVKNVVPLSANLESLNFEQNLQEIAVVASVPSSNAWLTLAGCGVLVCSLCATMAWNLVSEPKDQPDNSSSNSRTLEVSAPHVVARVMFDSAHFPPMFLDRRARVAGVKDRENIPVDEFTIDSLALQWLPEHTKVLDYEESNKSLQV